jgi:protease I
VHYPRLRLIEAGFNVQVVGPQKKTFKSKFGYWAIADTVFSEVKVETLTVLIIPGGWAPDRLRRFPECLELVRRAHESGVVIGHICHGGSVAVSANILKGVKSTAFCSIKDDVINAGGVWFDEKVVTDEGKKIVSAQTPEDLPLFMKSILELAH